MREHWIVQKTPVTDAKGTAIKASTPSGGKCWPSEEEALTAARKLVAKEGHKFHYCVYKSVAVVGVKKPVVEVHRMQPVPREAWHEDDTDCDDEACPLESCKELQRKRYSCKDNNCEDTECQRCFPTS